MFGRKNLVRPREGEECLCATTASVQGKHQVLPSEFVEGIRNKILL